MTLNGTFLDPSPATPPALIESAPPTILTLQLAPAPARAADPPETLLARSLQRQVEQSGLMTPTARAKLARDHGIALAALCGVGSAELARGIQRDASTVRKIVRRVCETAGIERGVAWDG